MKKQITILLLILGFTLQISAETFTKKTLDNKLDGRWYLTPNLPNNNILTVVDFKVRTDGNVKVDFLNIPGGLNISDTAFANGQLRINGKSQLGATTLILTVDNDKINGTFTAGFVSGSINGEREPTGAAKVNRLAVFDKVWQTINNKFYDPDFNGVDWQAMRGKYRPLVERATADSELYQVVHRMFKELKVSHLYFNYVRPNGSLFDEPNSSATRDTATAKSSPVTWKTVAPSVGYLRIAKFVENPEAHSAIDQAFAEIGKLPHLIVDVRGNGGGSGSLGMRLGDYLFGKQETLGFFSTREGLKNYKVKSTDDLDPSKLPVYTGYSGSNFWRELDKTGALAVATGGRAKQTYQGRVVVLIDEKCFSATEAFLGIMKERRRATLIGRKTPGGVLSGKEMSVGGNWRLFYPRADFRTVNKMKIEGVGIEPDIVVEKVKGKDADLKRALEFLQSKSE